MREIFSDEAVRIEKRVLGLVERNTMLFLVLEVFCLIPFEIRFTHGLRIEQVWLFRHILDLPALTLLVRGGWGSQASRAGPKGRSELDRLVMCEYLFMPDCYAKHCQSLSEQKLAAIKPTV